MKKKKKNLRAIAIQRQPAVPFVPESDMCLGRAEKQRRSEQKVLCFILVFKIELNILYIQSYFKHVLDIPQIISKSDF